MAIQSAIDIDDQLTSSWEGESSRSRIDDLDSVIEKAVYWTTITRDPLPDGAEVSDCPVLLTGDGLAPLFSMVVPTALTGERMARSESLWSDKEGSMIMAANLSVIDNRRLEGGMSSSGRDGEGVPTSTRTLVSEGRLENLIWSTRDAAKQVADGNVEHAQSTGSASRGGHHNPPSVGCGDLSLKSNDRTFSRNKLIEQIDSGFMVHSLMGAHTANPTSGDFSVTTSAILQIEDGEIIGAVRQAGLSGNLAKALAGKVTLGDKAFVNGSYTTGSMHLPDAILFEGLRVNPL
jgi:PmbA protein